MGDTQLVIAFDGLVTFVCVCVCVGGCINGKSIGKNLLDGIYLFGIYSGRA